jgi:CheY-like chemotaxis protein
MATILIVDDEYVMVESLSEILVWEGYDVLTAGNGREGLAELANLPAAVVLDYMMPVMDGIQMLRAMRSHPAYRSIPVILVTAGSRESIDGEPLWDVFLTKPFTPEALFKALRSVIRKRPR